MVAVSGSTERSHAAQQDRVDAVVGVVVPPERHRQVAEHLEGERHRELRQAPPRDGGEDAARRHGHDDGCEEREPGEVADRCGRPERTHRSADAARLQEVEDDRLVLHLLGQVPHEQGHDDLVAPAEHLTVVGLGPPRDGVGDRLERRGERDAEARRPAALQHPGRPSRPALDHGECSEATDDQLVETSVLALVTGLLVDERAHDASLPLVQIALDGPHRADHVRLDVGHQQRHRISCEGDLGAAVVPDGVEAVGERETDPPAPRRTPDVRRLGRAGLRHPPRLPG